MNISRRQAVRLMGLAAPVMSFSRSFAQTVQTSLDITHGPFVGTSESLEKYSIPEWFPNSKFGIWSHWGPQSAVGDGDWYARKMYIQGDPAYDYHLKRFGHPSKVGYKDTIPLFTADKWDPGHLMDLYKKAGAKYFVSMGVHHDNFDMWNSRYQPRWNAVAAGPKKDIVGLWGKAARDRGLRFGVSEHLSNSFDWYAPAHTSDSTGDFKGVPYDGSDPQFADLYHSYAEEPADFATTAKAMGRIAPESWKIKYFNRIKDLVDQHNPDMLYTDGSIPMGDYGLSLVAEDYNVSALKHKGDVQSVYFSKGLAECNVGTCVLDRERGISDDIWPHPWQTDTCIGNWHYKVGQQYKTPKKVIDLLVDIVSKNGNLLLNFPLPANGELDQEEKVVLQGITDWMAINEQGIFDSRPWTIYGEGPSTLIKAGNGQNESKKPDMGATDIRFTTKAGALYAFVQGWPGKEVSIQSFTPEKLSSMGKVARVRMLGRGQDLKFSQKATMLLVELPAEIPPTAAIGITLRVNFA